MLSIENGICIAVIHSLQGRTNEICYYITVNGQLLFKVKWSHLIKFLTKRFLKKFK